VSRRLAAVAPLVVAALVAALAGTGSAQTGEPAPSPVDLEAGRQLYLVSCTSCHGATGEGTDRGPSLVGVGAASAYYYLSSGRMPLSNPDVQPQRKPPVFSPRQIDQLTAYVASLDGGPPLPHIEWRQGDLSLGYELFSNNCAPCHSSAGAGGALGHAVYAPPLEPAGPLQIAAAVRVGPGAMPAFGPETFDEHELEAVVRYVMYLKEPEDRGGFGLGHLGPLPEGFVAWVVGLMAMLAVARWIGTRD
jgi:ubiquinol-cytochrome c reductase cytochrome c subunit